MNVWSSFLISRPCVYRSRYCTVYSCMVLLLCSLQKFPLFWLCSAASLSYWITKKFLFYDHPSLMMQFSGLTIRVSVIKVKSHLVRISFSRAEIVNFFIKKTSLKKITTFPFHLNCGGQMAIFCIF